MSAHITKDGKRYTLLPAAKKASASGIKIDTNQYQPILEGAKPSSHPTWKTLWLALQLNNDPPPLSDSNIRQQLLAKLTRRDLLIYRQRLAVSTPASSASTRAPKEPILDSPTAKDLGQRIPPPTAESLPTLNNIQAAKTTPDAPTGAAPAAETETRGCPISMVSGEELLSLDDAQLPGPVPFTWTRTYRSSHTRHIGLGCGWTHSACDTLTLTDTRVELHDHEGRCIPFHRPKIGQDSRNIPNGLSLEHPSSDHFTLKELGQPNKLFTALSPGSPYYRLSQIHHPHYRPHTGQGYLIQLHYDTHNRLTRLAGNWGKALELTRDPQGRISQLHLHNTTSGERKKITEYHYNSENDLTAQRNANNLGEDYTYSHHLLTQRTLTTGFNYHYQWDGTDHTARCLRNWGDNGIYDYRFTWDPKNHTSQATDSRGYTTTFKYNPYGQITEETDPEGHRHQYTYENGRKIAHTDPEGQQTTTYYDSENRPTGHRDALNHSEHHTYFKGKLTSYTNKANARWQYHYNLLGQLEATTDPYGLRTEYRYNQQGLITHITTPGNTHSRYQWTDQGELKSITDPAGHTRLLTYNAWGQIIQSELRLKGAILAGKTHYHYTPTGQIERIIGSGGKTTTYTYNPNDQLTQHSDPQGRLTQFDYDGLSQITKRTNPEGHSLHYEYDTERNLTGLTNENHQRHHFTYDGNERLIKETGFDGRTQHYKYNKAGQLIRHMDAGDIITDFERDAVGNMTSKTSRTVSSTPRTEERSRYLYDPMGRLIETYNPHQFLAFTYNLLGNLSQEHSCDINPHNQRIKSTMRDITYQNVWPGQRSHIALPDGQTIHYLFNEQQQLEKASLNGNTITQIQRDNLGRETQRQQGNLTTQSEYDPTGRLQKQHTSNQNNKQPSPIHREFGYDTFGNLNRIKDGPVETRYAYDLLNRLKHSEAINDGKITQETFHFDPAGNILDSSQNQPNQSNQSNQNNKQNNPNKNGQGNRLSFQGDRHFTYDKRGNLIQEKRGRGGKLITRYQYNLNNQLTKIEKNGQTTEYTYDPLGRRIKKQDEFGSTRYLWSGDQLIQEQRNEIKKTYIYEPESFKPLAMVQDGEVYHYHLDHLGTPQELSNSKGNIVWKARYTTYGNVAYKEVDEIENNIRFQGQYFDEESGLHYNRHRYYDPGVGQFTTQDPIGLLGGVNNYQYAPNPTGWIDPFGLSCKEENSKPDFYVGPSGPEATLPSTGYRYMRYKDDDGKVNKFAPMTIENKSAPTTYIGFEKYDTGVEARDAFQVKGPEIGPDHTGDGSWSDARLRGEFDTLQLYEDGELQARVPYMYGDKDKTQLEPIAEAYPEYGDGGAAQLHTEGKTIHFDKVDILPEK